MEVNDEIIRIYIRGFHGFEIGPHLLGIGPIKFFGFQPTWRAGSPLSLAVLWVLIHAYTITPQFPSNVSQAQDYLFQNAMGAFLPSFVNCPSRNTNKN
jgi:hypothetical protein